MSDVFPEADRIDTETSDSSNSGSEEEDGLQQERTTSQVEEPQGRQGTAFPRTCSGSGIWPDISHRSCCRESQQVQEPAANEAEERDCIYSEEACISGYITTQELIPENGVVHTCGINGEWEKLWDYLYEKTELTLNRITQLNATPEYKVYKIRQGKRGKLRNIEEPVPDLKDIQKALLPLFEKFPLTDSCTARRGSSAVLNAVKHRNAKHLLKIDIKKCYPSTDRYMICRGLNIIKDPKIKTLVEAVHFCIYPIPQQATDCLPTGAPTSPILCNIALFPVDLLVEKMLEEEYGDKYIYTRYLDDLIISTEHEERDWAIKHEVETLLLRGGWHINRDKSKWFTANESDKLVVTGVRVGDKYGVPREFQRHVRARLNNLAEFKSEIDPETQGCLAYIKSIDERKHQQLLTYFERRKNYENSTNSERTST
jgi:hypothetical protein